MLSRRLWGRLTDTPQHAHFRIVAFWSRPGSIGEVKAKGTRLPGALTRSRHDYYRLLICPTGNLGQQA